MSDLKSKVQEEFEALRRSRDELRVQMHLAKADAQDLWKQLEHKFVEVENRIKSVAREAEQPVHDVAEAARLLLAEIGEGYRKIRSAL